MSRERTNIADNNDGSLDVLVNKARLTTGPNSVASEEWIVGEDESPAHRMAGAAVTELMSAANVTIVFMVG